ncbi:MAG: hypothetical protein M9893_02330 [Pyrinomonadaceae bacterium]|nr:hypothetical protein [Pyrinomonadaceae bacterium]
MARPADAQLANVDAGAKDIACREFEQSKEVSYKKLRKLLKLSDDININLDKSSIATKPRMRSAIPARWDAR